MTQHQDQDPGWSARRINSIGASIRARTYLEIGVAAGETFRQVYVPVRTGVDPSFRFDVESMIDEDTRLHQQGSDDFFVELASAATYDVIFLDGLHTFEQTYRDLCNCLMHLQPVGALLIDDTLPADPYSSLPDQERSLRLRRAAGLPGHPWHGDTFKVVLMIHDFHPGLAYRTILGSGNPQTLVWRSNAQLRKPRFESIEAISRMSYFDLLDNQDMLFGASEGEAIAACLEALGTPDQP